MATTRRRRRDPVADARIEAIGRALVGRKINVLDIGRLDRAVADAIEEGGETLEDAIAQMIPRFTEVA